MDSRIKDTVSSFVKERNERLPFVVNYLHTVIEQYSISSQELEEVFSEVKEEEVDPFVDSEREKQVDRLDRFRRLCEEMDISFG